MSSPQPSGRRPASYRGGRNGNSNLGRGGRSSARGRGGGPRKGNNNHQHHVDNIPSRQNNRNGRPGRGRSQQPSHDQQPGLRDEDVLIAFMPYLKGNHPEALRIHEEYQSGNKDQHFFLEAARGFLRGDAAASDVVNNGSGLSPHSHPAAPAPSTPAISITQSPSTPSAGSITNPSMASERAAPGSGADFPSEETLSQRFSSQPPQSSPYQPKDHHAAHSSSYEMTSQGTSTPLPLSTLFSSSTSDPTGDHSMFLSSHPISNLNHAALSPSFAYPNNGSASNSLASRVLQPIQDTERPFPPEQRPFTSNVISNVQLPLDDKPQELESSMDGLRMTSIERGLDSLMDDGPPQTDPVTPTLGTGEQPFTQDNFTFQVEAHHGNTSTAPLSVTPLKPSISESRGLGASGPWTSINPTVAASAQLVSPNQVHHSEPTPGAGNEKPSTKVDIADHTRTPTKREVPPQKRLWTYPDEQPGRIVVNGRSGEDYSVVLPLGPREELTAHWAVSLDYLRKYAAQKYGPNASMEVALSKMTLGLFRRGCTENGTQISIISKNVLGEFRHDPASNNICGKVPFYSPRTPGHVVFRLFWEDDPVYTLATGPTILVRVFEPDFESSVRFILSNFKGKKSNPTSLSSLHSLAIILETQITRPNDSAARATWGCVQEARKVVEACAQEHEKTSNKLVALEKSIEELKKQIDVEPGGVQERPDNSAVLNGGDGEMSEAALELKEKTRTLMSGRASCERKWRDSQLAFAGILRAIVVNQSMVVLLRRDLILKMRVEYELWCPLSEEFAIPDDSARIWYEPLRDLPQSLSALDFKRFSQARVEMQLRTLCFEPNTVSLEDVLYPQDANKAGRRSVDPGAVDVFNKISANMGQAFQKLFHDEDVVMRRRELVRQRTEECVNQSGIFPPGTKVIIFGSSANGFGSPNSDLDMCLQLAEDRTRNGQNLNGVDAMSKLADFMKVSGGMTNVDTDRLNARIPIVMYRCPNPIPLAEGNSNTEDFIECDISIQNPLAVLNTSLLRTYSNVSPVPRVMSLIIKRWAKARDINNPARHTLSSYGYIIMLLHFLTFHKRSGNGLVSPVARPEGDPSLSHHSAQRPTPLLPNLQWMDPTWPGSPSGTPYRELRSLPREIVLHPMEEGKHVNRYFYKAKTANEATLLKQQFIGNDLSLSMLLASFFRYYAYEFDYKRFVVSLHSTGARGMVEREVKAELDGWRNYSAALTIEDPFETFYDVAHVLRGGCYHRIRREFAVAYTKIADAALGRPGSWNKGDLRSLSGEELMDWLCEPIEKEGTGEEDL